MSDCMCVYLKNFVLDSSAVHPGLLLIPLVRHHHAVNNRYDAIHTYITQNAIVAYDFVMQSWRRPLDANDGIGSPLVKRINKPAYN